MLLNKNRTSIFKRIFEYWPFILIFSVVLIFYGKYVAFYFSQDDFFLLRVTQSDGTLWSLLKLIGLRPYSESGIYFYRPIFRELVFNLYHTWFGVNPLPFRLTHFLIHFINIILTYKVFIKIFKNKIQAYVSALFVGLLAANVGVLSYLAGGITVSGMLMFGLLSILYYLKTLKTPAFKYQIISYLFFLGAIASHETGSVIPAILLGLRIREFGLNWKIIKSSIRSLIIYFAPIIFLFLAEVYVIGLPVNESGYALSFTINGLLNSYFWYSLWAVGIPEMLLDFVGPGIKINPDLMKYWGNYYSLIFLLFISTATFVIFCLKKIIKDKDVWFFLFWFIVGLTPIVFLPFHRQYHYLEISLPAVAGIVSIVYIKLKEKSAISSMLFLISLLCLNFTSIRLADTTYWSIQRSKESQVLVKDFMLKYPKLPKGASVYFTNSKTDPYLNEDWGHSSKQASVILSGSDALQVIYKDKSIKAFYEDINKPPYGQLVFPFEVNINR